MTRFPSFCITRKYRPFADATDFGDGNTCPLPRTSPPIGWPAIGVAPDHCCTSDVTGTDTHPAAHDAEYPFAVDTDPTLDTSDGCAVHRVAVVASADTDHASNPDAVHEYDHVSYTDNTADDTNAPDTSAGSNRMNDRAFVDPPSYVPTFNSLDPD